MQYEHTFDFRKITQELISRPQRRKIKDEQLY